MMHKVGERISSFRRERKMSQEELATLLNVSRQTISKWETGDTLPDVYNAVALANLFHVSLDQLILGAHSRHSGTSYISQLKAKRYKTNLRAIIVGSIGSTMFATSIVLVKALAIQEPYVGIIFACILPILMFCWGFAIWGFINVSRISEEMKYLQNLEMMSIQLNRDKE